MKRHALLRHLRRHGCYLKREGGEHTLWSNPVTGVIEAVPRHIEIPNQLVRKICRHLSIPEIGRCTGPLEKRCEGSLEGLCRLG